MLIRRIALSRAQYAYFIFGGGHFMKKIVAGTLVFALVFGICGRNAH